MVKAKAKKMKRIKVKPPNRKSLGTRRETVVMEQ